MTHESGVSITNNGNRSPCSCMISSAIDQGEYGCLIEDKCHICLSYPLQLELHQILLILEVPQKVPCLYPSQMALGMGNGSNSPTGEEA